MEFRWEQRKLGDISDIQTGGTPKTKIKEYWNPKEIPWMSSGEINKKRIKKTDKKISIFGHENSSARWIKKNSVLVALAGQGKTRGLVAVNEINLTTNQSIAAIIPTESLYFEFLFHNLEKRYEELRSISSGDGTRGGLNKQLVSNLLIKLPAYDEQVKIGEILKKVDILINLHQRKINILNKIKKIYLKEIFADPVNKVPNLRFKGFKEVWEQRQIRDLSEVTFGGGTPSTSNLDYWNGNIPWIQSSDLIEHNVESICIKKKITETALNNSSAKKIPKDSIAIVTRVGVGKVAFVPFEYSTSQDFLSLSNLYIDKKFGVYLLYQVIQRHSMALQGTSIKGVTKKEILSKNVFIPSDISEQGQVGSLQKEIDKLISLHQRKLNQLEKLKTSYLRKMFL